jgi:hypothetical protein
MDLTTAEILRHAGHGLILAYIIIVLLQLLKKLTLYLLAKPERSDKNSSE